MASMDSTCLDVLNKTEFREVKAQFPWARAALLVRIEHWKPHL